MSDVHLDGDLRVCGATTVVSGQGSVYVNGKLWAVQGDQNSHTDGQLLASGTSVLIEGNMVIVHAPDQAADDVPGHGSDTRTAEGSDNVSCY